MRSLLLLLLLPSGAAVAGSCTCCIILNQHEVACHHSVCTVGLYAVRGRGIPLQGGSGKEAECRSA